MAVPTLDSSAAAVISDAQFINIPYPGTVNSGDLLLIIYGKDSDTDPETPSGWTLVKTDVISGEVRASVFSKIATGSESGTLSFHTQQPGVIAIARMFRSTDADTVEAAAASNASSKTIDHPDIVTTGADRLALAVTVINDN